MSPVRQVSVLKLQGAAINDAINWNINVVSGQICTPIIASMVVLSRPGSKYLSKIELTRLAFALTCQAQPTLFLFLPSIPMLMLTSRFQRDNKNEQKGKAKVEIIIVFCESES